MLLGMVMDKDVKKVAADAGVKAQEKLEAAVGAVKKVRPKKKIKTRRQTFLEETVLTLGPENFANLRDALLEGCINVRFMEDEAVTPEVMAEKIYDHFDKTVQKTGQTFGQQLMDFADKISLILSGYVTQRIPGENDKDEGEISRAYKYYLKATAIKGKKELSTEDVLSFSRIMFCLYAEARKGKAHKILDFDYSAKAVHPAELIEMLRKEQTEGMLGISRPVFDLDDWYGIDANSMIIAIIMLYKIVEDRVEE